MKPDEYERARSLICKSFGNYCGYCPLYDVDNCHEQTDEAEKILLKIFGICPKGYEEAEKEECRSDAAAKYRVDTLIKGLRKVQAYCAEQQHRCRECAFWDDEKIECKFYRSYPAAWNLDGDDGADADTNGKGV